MRWLAVLTVVVVVLTACGGRSPLGTSSTATAEEARITTTATASAVTVIPEPAGETASSATTTVPSDGTATPAPSPPTASPATTGSTSVDMGRDTAEPDPAPMPPVAAPAVSEETLAGLDDAVDALDSLLPEFDREIDEIVLDEEEGVQLP